MDRREKKRKEFLESIKDDPNRNQKYTDYLNMEDKILDDDDFYNKKLEEKKQELYSELSLKCEMNHGLTHDGCSYDKTRRAIIKIKMEEKRVFLEGEKTQKTNKFQKTDTISDKTLSLGKDNLSMNYVLPTDPNEVLLKKYEEELLMQVHGRKLKQLRKELIMELLKKESQDIKWETTTRRKLLTEAETLRKKYKDMPKDQLEKEIAVRHKKRMAEIKKYKHMGIDPLIHDRESLHAAEDVMRSIINMSRTEQWSSMSNDERMVHFKEKYGNFINTFPIVYRFMIQEGRYSSVAFQKYLVKCRDNTDGDKMYKWLENQAYYVKFLHEETLKQHNKHINKKQLEDLFQHTLKELKRERENVEEKAVKSRDIRREKSVADMNVWRDQITSQAMDLDDDKKELLIKMLKKVNIMKNKETDREDVINAIRVS